MISTKPIMSLLLGATALLGTLNPAPALAIDPNKVMLNQMAMQMYMNQQANAGYPAAIAQQQAMYNYNAQAALAAQNPYVLNGGVNYNNYAYPVNYTGTYPVNYAYNNGYSPTQFVTPVAQNNMYNGYANTAYGYGNNYGGSCHHEHHHDGYRDWHRNAYMGRF